MFTTSLTNTTDLIQMGIVQQVDLCDIKRSIGYYKSLSKAIDKPTLRLREEAGAAKENKRKKKQKAKGAEKIEAKASKSKKHLKRQKLDSVLL